MPLRARIFSIAPAVASAPTVRDWIWVSCSRSIAFSDRVTREKTRSAFSAAVSLAGA